MNRPNFFMQVKIIFLLSISIISTSYAFAYADNVKEQRYYNNYIQLRDLYENKDIRALQKTCHNSSVEYKAMCGLLMYLAQDKRDEQAFLLTVPKTKEESELLWRTDALLMRQSDRKTLFLFPSGFAARYIDEIFSLVELRPEISLERIFTLYRYSDGEYAEFIADKIFLTFKDRPDLIYANWPLLRKYGKQLDRVFELYLDELDDIKEGFNKICRAKTREDNRCMEINKFFIERGK